MEQSTFMLVNSYHFANELGDCKLKTATFLPGNSSIIMYQHPGTIEFTGINTANLSHLEQLKYPYLIFPRHCFIQR